MHSTATNQDTQRFDKAFKYAKQIAYSSETVLKFSYEMAMRYKERPGIMIEAGVAAGAQVIMMSAACPGKSIFAFDSYCGIPRPSNRDDQMPGIKILSKEDQGKLPNPGEQVLETTGVAAVSLESFMNHLDMALDGHSVYPIEGWFEETVPEFCNTFKFSPGTGIDVLRLDGDLYNSTLVCLQNFFPRALGVVIIDDIQLPGCKAACDDYFNSINYTPFYRFVDNVAYFFV